MPSGPALGGDADWAPVVWSKSVPKGKASKSASAVNEARRTGVNVEVSSKFDQSKSQKFAKLDENGENFKHETVGNEFKKALMQARMAKKMSQQALGTAINEKATVINEYEAGKAIPNGAIINKLNKALGVRLPKAKS